MDVRCEEITLLLPEPTIVALKAAAVARNSPISNTASAAIAMGISAMRENAYFDERMKAALANQSREIPDG